MCGMVIAETMISAIGWQRQDPKERIDAAPHRQTRHRVGRPMRFKPALGRKCVDYLGGHSEQRRRARSGPRDVGRNRAGSSLSTSLPPSDRPVRERVSTAVRCHAAPLPRLAMPSEMGRSRSSRWQYTPRATVVTNAVPS